MTDELRSPLLPLLQRGHAQTRLKTEGYNELPKSDRRNAAAHYPRSRA